MKPEKKDKNKKKNRKNQKQKIELKLLTDRKQYNTKIQTKKKRESELTYIMKRCVFSAKQL